MQPEFEDYQVAALDRQQQDEPQTLETNQLLRDIGYNEWLRNFTNLTEKI
jgi:hypothetical protein